MCNIALTKKNEEKKRKNKNKNTNCYNKSAEM